MQTLRDISIVGVFIFSFFLLSVKKREMMEEVLLFQRDAGMIRSRQLPSLSVR